MPKRIVIVQGHPDPAGGHFGHALAEAYSAGAQEAGHEVRRIIVAALNLPLLRTKEDWERGTPPPAVLRCQDDIGWADHIVIVYPLWLGSMPAILKGFFEHVFRPGFAISFTKGGMWKKLLQGRSARIVVTMGMPALIYRWYFGAHSLKSLERNILGFCGIKPIRESIVGLVEGSPRRREKWLVRMRDYGRRGV
jgi:putative NADPH-quinone reductase